MKHSFRVGLAIVLAGVIVWGYSKTTRVRDEAGKYEVGRITEKMKTACVGRFLIDMPVKAEIEISGVRVEGLKIVAYEESLDEFRKRLAERETALDSKPVRHGGIKNLEAAREIRTDSGLVGKIFVHNRTITEGTAGNGLENESYRYEGVAVEALVHGRGVSIDLGSEYYSPDRVDNVSHLVSQLVPNPGNALPQEPGFCIDHAYLRDPRRADQREQITMFANLPSHPDISFMLITAAGMKPDEDGLLKRGDAADAELPLTARFRLTRLRAAPRQIGDLFGEELVRRGIEEHDAQVYSFWWEVNGTQDDVFTPHLELTMTAGKSSNGPVQSSISEDAALELWDKVSSGIRRRLVEQQPSDMVEGPAKAKTPTSATTRLSMTAIGANGEARLLIGSYSSTGRASAASSWWHCEESHAPSTRCSRRAWC